MPTQNEPEWLETIVIYPSCGRVSIKVEGRWPYHIIRAKMHGKPVGFLFLSHKNDALTVDLTRVLNPRCGIGTKLYERAYKIACKHRIPLASSTERSDASEGFWRKQVAKGRAYCVSTNPRANRLYDDPEKGLIETDMTWPCGRYLMRQTCLRKVDLSGRR